MTSREATWSHSSSAVRWSFGREGVALSLLAFAAALTIFLLVPPFLTQQVGWAQGFTGQEAMDLLTPIVTMPLIFLAVEATGRSGTSLRVVLIGIIGVWVAGQGIHLAANAIGDVFDSGAPRDAFYATTVGTFDHFLDETLSHWLWHVGWVGLLAVLLWVGVAGRADGTAPSALANGLAGIAGAVHGFTWFVVTDEGGTWALAIPATAVLLGIAYLVRRRDGPGSAIRTFLVTGSILTLVLYVAWILVAGWTPASILDHLKLL